MTLFHVTLRAQNETLNVNRIYEITIEKTLFNHWTVTLAWGRYGNRNLQKKTYSFPDKRIAIRLTRFILRKRFSAHKRIGVDYEIEDYKDSLEIL